MLLQDVSFAVIYLGSPFMYGRKLFRGKRLNRLKLTVLKFKIYVIKLDDVEKLKKLTVQLAILREKKDSGISQI